MAEPVVLVGFLVSAFAVSAALAYWITGRKPKIKARPKLGSNLRLRGAGGMYRAKLLGIDEQAWRISCPLSRNSYVPLRIDDHLAVEAPVENGVIIFRTHVSGRDEETHELLLAAPDSIAVTDRRNEPRRPAKGLAHIEGEEAALVDISTLGARILTNRPCHVGERVRVEFNENLIYGWVLDFWPNRSPDSFRESVRVRFEEVLPI